MTRQYRLVATEPQSGLPREVRMSELLSLIPEHWIHRDSGGMHIWRCPGECASLFVGLFDTRGERVPILELGPAQRRATEPLAPRELATPVHVPAFVPQPASSEGALATRPPRGPRLCGGDQEAYGRLVDLGMAMVGQLQAELGLHPSFTRYTTESTDLEGLSVHVAPAHVLRIRYVDADRETIAIVYVHHHVERVCESMIAASAKITLRPWIADLN